MVLETTETHEELSFACSQLNFKPLFPFLKRAKKLCQVSFLSCKQKDRR